MRGKTAVEVGVSVVEIVIFSVILLRTSPAVGDLVASDVAALIAAVLDGARGFLMGG